MSNDSKAESTPMSIEEFHAVAKKCAPSVSISTLSALVRTESSFHPYAIAVVNGPSYYPDSLNEAKDIIKQLESTAQSYSVGLGQVNNANFAIYDVNAVALLDPCVNLKISSEILSKCYKSASAEYSSQAEALSAALSCYYSGNFETGKQLGYVSRVVSNSKVTVPPINILKDGHIDSDTAVSRESFIVTTDESLSTKPII